MSIFGGGGGDTAVQAKEKAKVNVRYPGWHQGEKFSRAHLGQILDPATGQAPANYTPTPFGVSFAEQLANRLQGERTRKGSQWQGIETRYWNPAQTKSRTLRGYGVSQYAGDKLSPEEYKRLKKKHAKPKARSYGGYASRYGQYPGWSSSGEH